MPLTLARRAWVAPIAVHVAALCLVLAAGAVFVGTHASFTEDEGAAIVQARELADHSRWAVPHPHPELDRDGHFYPYVLSSHGEHGFFPFAKHPMYSLLLAALWRAGGVTALVALSLLGTVMAALVAARFARRVHADFERPVFWGVGVASPLLVDGYLVVAHTIGAAISGALVLVLTAAAPRRAWGVAAAAALAAGLVLMRTEGVLLVGAAGAVVFLSRRNWWLGATAAVVGAATFVGERVWLARIVGPVAPTPAPNQVVVNANDLGSGGLAGRVDSAVHTLVSPGDAGRVDVLLLLMLVAIAAAAVTARGRPRPAGVLAAGAAVAAVARVGLHPRGAVSGLFVACPLVWAALWAGLEQRGERARSLDGRLLAIIGLFVAAVLATQYPEGGGREWGGRFLALALPCAVALAVVVIHPLPRWVIVGVGVASVAVSALGMAELRSSHGRMERLLSSARVPAGAVAVTTQRSIPRLDWKRYEERQWLLVPAGRVAELVVRAKAAGVKRVFVLFPPGQAPRGVLGVKHRLPGSSWQTLDIALD